MKIKEEINQRTRKRSFCNGELELRRKKVEEIMDEIDRENLGDKWKYVLSMCLIIKLEEWVFFWFSNIN